LIFSPISFTLDTSQGFDRSRVQRAVGNIFFRHSGLDPESSGFSDTAFSLDVAQASEDTVLRWND
jgi:hypothetical protein